LYSASGIHPMSLDTLHVRFDLLCCNYNDSNFTMHLLSIVAGNQLLVYLAVLDLLLLDVNRINTRAYELTQNSL
jgi:hypothetical protein